MVEKVDSTLQRGVRFGAEWSNEKKGRRLTSEQIVTHASTPKGLANYNNIMAPSRGLSTPRALKVEK